MTAGSRIPVSAGGGNVFTDLGLSGAHDLQLMAELTRQIYHRIKSLGLTQVQAAKRLGLKQPDVSKLMQGRHTGFSANRLIALLNALEIDVDIVLRPHRKQNGKPGSVRVRAARAV